MDRLPADWFPRETHGLLAQYCRHVTTARRLARLVEQEKAVTNWLREAAHEAGLTANSSPHGLRKAACRRLAEAGGSTLEIMSITGHKALAEVGLYTREVRQQALAGQAMGRVTEAFPERTEPFTVPNPV